MSQWKPRSSLARSRDELAEKPLPAGVVHIRDILDGQIGLGRFISVIGLVKDMRAPMATRGTDWKSALTIFDKSTEADGAGLTVNIFWPQDRMPQPNAGDVVLVYYAKVNNFQGELGLITNRQTEINVFTASEIPRPPRSAAMALKPDSLRKARAPTEKELEFVSWFYHAADKYAVPAPADFETQVSRSTNIKDKLCALQDVQEGRFCDLVVQVVKDPFDQIDKVSLWVSDYTEHNSFFKFSWDGSVAGAGRDGDPYGYTSVNIDNMPRGWPGPFGRRSMQITCYEPHATYIRAEVKAGDWVKLRNVQIKFGHNGNNLEGFLREDRGAFGSRIAVEVLDTTGHVDDLFKEVIRRKRDYEKTAKQQKKTYAATDGVGKRVNGMEEPKPEGKSKQRRKAKRAALQKKAQEQETKKVEVLGLNELIKCESLDEPVFPLSSLLEPVLYHTAIDGQEVQLTLPFTNAKYRANVRVVDFRPRKLEDFAVWRKVNEYDVLSDYSGGSNSESDNDAGTLDGFVGQKTWEWSFALQLEEAGARPGKSDQPERLWALVSNIEAQQLVSLDASDLRANPDDLIHLREQLFKLWGNLEEHKTRQQQAQLQSRKRLEAHEPPPDSSDNEDGSNDEQNVSDQSLGKVSNRPFTCCLRQYGVELPEQDLAKCNAGEGKRYERMFGLFGTKTS
ncbi:hypothetical protein BJ170DRAFT_643115 [Xylariales sp. AK1849]|nr:hypothetical protein BJ170DRAFT_643115 [Xylariales sp. AK1849]